MDHTNLFDENICVSLFLYERGGVGHLSWSNLVSWRSSSQMWDS